MSKARELYEDLSREFTRRGVGGSDFSKLENLYHLASDNEKLQPHWRKLQQKTINQLIDKEHDADFLKDDLFKLVLLILDNWDEKNIKDMAGRLSNIHGIYKDE